MNDSSQGVCVLIGHLNVWSFWLAWDFAAEGKEISDNKTVFSGLPDSQGVSIKKERLLSALCSGPCLQDYELLVFVISWDNYHSYKNK